MKDTYAITPEGLVLYVEGQPALTIATRRFPILIERLAVALEKAWPNEAQPVPGVNASTQAELDRRLRERQRIDCQDVPVTVEWQRDPGD